jgi:hypothetical protein
LATHTVKLEGQGRKTKKYNQTFKGGFKGQALNLKGKKPALKKPSLITILSQDDIKSESNI